MARINSYSIIALVLLFILGACNNQGNSITNTEVIETPQDSPRVGGPCDTCELIYIGMPQNINAIDTSEAWHESEGQRLVVTGTVYKQDKTTPAVNIILYYWQTDHNGVYPEKAGLNPKARRHGYLRGWVKTDEKGKYTIYTIRPGSYPNSQNPQHIHMLVKEPRHKNEYYIDDIVFEDDPLLTEQIRNRLEQRGGNGVVSPVTRDGVQQVTRDIILGLNIPDYPVK